MVVQYQLFKGNALHGDLQARDMASAIAEVLELFPDQGLQVWRDNSNLVIFRAADGGAYSIREKAAVQ